MDRQRITETLKRQTFIRKSREQPPAQHPEPAHADRLATKEPQERMNTENENLLISSRLVTDADGAPRANVTNETFHKARTGIDSDTKRALESFFGNDEEEDNQGKLEDGRISKLEFSKLKTQEYGLLFFSITGIVVSIMAYDLEFDEARRYSLEATVALWINFSSSFVLIFLTVMRYLQAIIFLKSRNVLSKKADLLSSGELPGLIIEIIIILLQPYPFFRGLQFSFSNVVSGRVITYNVNDIFYVLILLRLYLPIRVMLSQTSYYTTRAQRLCDMYGAERGYMFTIKCLMKISPFEVIVISLISSLFILGYALRICEKPFFAVDEKVDLQNYLNCVWLVIVTMTTVGYGDYYPRTIAGRGVIFIGCIWGVCIVSLMVVTITNTLNLSSGESKALTVIERLECRKVLKSEAACILTNMAKIGLIRKKKTLPQKVVQKQTLKAVVNIKKHADTFKFINRQIKARALDDVDLSEEMSRHFEFLRDEIKVLVEGQGRMGQKLSELAKQHLSKKDTPLSRRKLSSTIAKRKETTS